MKRIPRIVVMWADASMTNQEIADALIAHEGMSVTAVSVMAPEEFGMSVVDGIDYDS
jgi:hypothetical protein